MSALYSARCAFVSVAAGSVACALAGCAAYAPDELPGSKPEPPELQVHGVYRSYELTKEPVPYSLEIKNGAGDVLYTGEVGKIERRLPLWKMDGTLVITTIWSNRTTTTQTLKSTPEKPVEIVYDPLQALPQQRYVLVALAEPPASVAALYAPGEIKLNFGYGKLDDQAPTFGVNLGADTPLQKASSKIDYYSVGLDIPLKRIEDWIPQLEAKAKWGDKSTGSESSVGSRGEAFQGGLHGGSGGFASTAPSTSRVKTSYNEQTVGLSVESPWLLFNQSEYSKLSKEFEVVVDRMSRKYDSTLQYPTLPGLAGYDNQKVTTWNLGAGLGASGTHWFDSKVSFSAGGRLNVNYVWGDYSGTHHYTNPLAAPVNQDFTQTTGDSKNVLTWSGRAFGELGYSPDRNTQWSALFEYGFLGNGLGLQNKVTPSDPNPHLVNGSLRSWQGGVRYRARF